MKFTHDLSTSDQQNLKAIAAMLLARREHVAIAESVTSGHIQARFSAAEQATRFYEGGMTTYNLHQKVRLLGVDREVAKINNCVSEEVAQQMARGVAKQYQSDWGIGITGFAAPMPELGVEKLYAYFSFFYKGQVVKTEKLLGMLDRETEVQQRYASLVIQNFKHHLAGSG